MRKLRGEYNCAWATDLALKSGNQEMQWREFQTWIETLHILKIISIHIFTLSLKGL